MHFRGSSPPLPDAASPPHADPETDSEDTIVLQFSQMTLPQFALDAMQQALTLLKTGPDRQLTTHLIHLIHKTFSLMSVAMTADIWQDSSVSGRLLVGVKNPFFPLLDLGVLVKGEASTNIYADWVNGKWFRNLTTKVWANLDYPIKSYDFSKFWVISCGSQVALC